MLVYGEILDFGEVENPYREVRGVTNLFGTLFKEIIWAKFLYVFNFDIIFCAEVIGMKKEKITFEEYREILKSGLEISSFGEIPQVIDQVTIGDIERSRR